MDLPVVNPGLQLTRRILHQDRKAREGSLALRSLRSSVKMPWFGLGSHGKDLPPRHDATTLAGHSLGSRISTLTGHSLGSRISTLAARLAFGPAPAIGFGLEVHLIPSFNLPEGFYTKIAKHAKGVWLCGLCVLL